MSQTGLAGFCKYYETIYGERWSPLYQQLQLPPLQVARRNSFSKKEILLPAFTQLPGCYQWTQSLGHPTGSLAEYFVMDPASIVAAQALQVKAGDKLLDLCAAPGGKSLILAEAMGQDGELVANELSEKRRDRLKRVLRDYLPIEVMHKVKVTGHDGSRWGLYHPQSCDRILVDAPCSGERHLLVSGENLQQWSVARGRHLSIRQYALLASAWLTLKPGGRMLYSTCSINPLENDQVIAKLLKKKKDEVRIVECDLLFSGMETTLYGRQIMPDRAEGAGPIYFSLIEKLNKY